AYIRCFDVALIPYLLNEYSRFVYPNKLNEYLIMGKPVVSTGLPEVEYFNESHGNIVSVVHNHAAFISQIQYCLDQDSDTLRAQRTAFVESNAWDKKIEAMQSLIQAKLDRKAKMREQNWQHAFLKFYRTTQRKVGIVTTAVLVVYLLVFHTSLVWVIAEPLRVVQQPVSGDVIAVLAGGIGESGQPSDAYEEKINHAVALYHQGHAKNLLFSSGATRVFNEAEVMKALAVSLGVPREAILLDEKGGGNYFSLLTLRGELKTRGWTKVLLVTSLYNGARSQLVARKNLSGVEVTIVPPDKSRFFGEQRRVDWRHLRAIIHEYAAIAYYWSKGYI
ncbi:MAG: hypothetical protein C4576_10120, partial [Desulfobacteraceae bacterium]